MDSSPRGIRLTTPQSDRCDGQTIFVSLMFHTDSQSAELLLPGFHLENDDSSGDYTATATPQRLLRGDFRGWVHWAKITAPQTGGWSEPHDHPPSVTPFLPAWEDASRRALTVLPARPFWLNGRSEARFHGRFRDAARTPEPYGEGIRAPGRSGAARTDGCSVPAVRPRWRCGHGP